MPLQTAYNEYKFHVSGERLPYVRSVLDALYGGSDPFPQGVVDSIYFDTYDRRCFRQCLDGNTVKTKFRIRGYGDGTFRQVHRKEKDILGVGKNKAAIAPVRVKGSWAPVWSDLVPLDNSRDPFLRIQSCALTYGLLIPAIRVRYFRYRFRVNDFRITLDTNIEVMGFGNGVDNCLGHSVIPYHVLEIKTRDPRPHLPFLGLARLPQISFSKFFLGLNLLASGEIDETDDL